jgi:hypothetical protein
VREAGGRNVALVKELAGVTVGDSLLIELTPTAGAKLPAIVAGIELQVEE